VRASAVDTVQDFRAPMPDRSPLSPAPGAPAPPTASRPADRPAAPPAWSGLDSASGLPPQPVRDAVFEDIDAGSRAYRGAPPAAVEPPVLGPPPSASAAPAAPGYTSGFAPSSGDGAPAYSPDAGFRIDFDEAEEMPSTALAPVAAPAATLPAPAPPQAPAPPAAPVAPRAEARRAVRDKAQMLRRHKWLILTTTLLGLGGAALYNATAPVRYEAYSVLLVSTPGEEGTEADLNSGFTQATGTDQSRVLNQALILQQNPAIAEQTAETLLARTDARGLSTVRDATETVAGPLAARDYATYLQNEVVTVKPAGENVDAIRVQATAGTPEEAALIATLFTERYQSMTRETNLGRVRQTRDALEEQVVRRQGELDEIESRLEAYMTAENAAGLDAQTQSTVSNIGTLQANLDLARVQVRTQEAQLAQLQQDLASAGPRLQASAAAPSQIETTALDTQISDLERLMEQIYQRNPQYRGNPGSHPDLAQMQSRLDGLRGERQRAISGAAQSAVASGGLDLGSQGSNGAQYLSDIQRQISSTRAGLEGARAQVSALASRLGEASGQLREIPAQQVELAGLQRQREATAQTLLGLRQELDRTELASTTELGLTQTVRDVQVPTEPAAPKKPLNLALGTLLGLLVGIVLAAVRYRTDARAHTPDDLADQGFAVVGTVPNLAAALKEGRQDVDGSSVHPLLVTLTQPFSGHAEAFRHIHANLTTGSGAPPQVVLVSGAEIGSGKSTVATNLAVAAAQAGRRVLLVDADLRKPSVADLLGLGDRPALGEGPDGSNLVYWSTAVPSLFAMTPRETAQTPDQMWAPHQIGGLLANLRSAFDLILIDAPPALVSADTALLAPHADAALLVAEAGRSDLDALAQVATELSGVGMTRIGAVLNRFNPRRAVGYRQTAAVRHTSRRDARPAARGTARDDARSDTALGAAPSDAAPLP
jgi:capsular exopolysaccharide synthesis family protein